MKPSRILLLWVLCALLPAGLRADTVAFQEVINGMDTLMILNPAAYAAGAFTDPELVVRRLKRGSVPLSGFTFDFSSDSGTGFFDFRNDNLVGLMDLTLNITPGAPFGDANLTFGCGIQTELDVLPFSDCVFSQIGTENSSTVITFFGSSGLPPQSHFAIELTGFPANATVVGNANPEAPGPTPPSPPSTPPPAPDSGKPPAVIGTSPGTESVPEPETLPLLLIGVLAIASGRLLRKNVKSSG